MLTRYSTPKSLLSAHKISSLLCACFNILRYIICLDINKTMHKTNVSKPFVYNKGCKRKKNIF